MPLGIEFNQKVVEPIVYYQIMSLVITQFPDLHNERMTKFLFF
jgi:hypothetical protein